MIHAPKSKTFFGSKFKAKQQMWLVINSTNLFLIQFKLKGIIVSSVIFGRFNIKLSLGGLISDFNILRCIRFALQKFDKGSKC